MSEQTRTWGTTTIGWGLTLAAVGMAGAGALSGPPPSALGQAGHVPSLDESYTVISLDNERVREGSGYGWRWRPTAKLRFWGAWESAPSRGDAVVLRLRKGRRTLGDYRCPLEIHGASGTTSLSRCWHRHEATLDAHGEIDADVLFQPDSGGPPQLVRSLKLRVARFWQVEGRDATSTKYQVVTDDLLGLSWLWKAMPDDPDPRGAVYLYFWATLSEQGTFPEPSLRCQVDGRPVDIEPENLGYLHESISRIEARDVRWERSGQQRIRDYGARLIWVKPRLTWIPEGARSDPADTRPSLNAMPGTWTCAFRSEGQPIRAWTFVVKPGAEIDLHPVQTSQNGLALRPGAVFLETRFPNPSPLEHTFQPAVIRRQVAFGHPWPAAESLRGMMSALPPARGESAPARAPR